MDQTVQRPPVLIQMGDNQRLRLCLRGPSGIVLHQRLVERRGLTFRQGFPLAQRLFYRLFLLWREFHHRTARRPGAFFSRHLLRRDLLNGGQGAVHIPLNQAVDRRSQLRYLAHNLFHDGNVGGAALLRQPERLARRDGRQLVGIPAGHRPSTAGGDEGVGFCHIGQPHHRALVEQEQGVAEIGCLPIALQQLRVVEERRRRARIHASTLHFPDRAMRRRQTDDARTGLFRQQTDGTHDCPELGGFPHPGIPLNHREPVRALQNHPGRRPLSGGQFRHQTVRHAVHQGGHRVFTFQHPGQDAFLGVPGLTGYQQVIATPGCHRYIQQLPRPDLCLDGRVDVRHRNLPAPGFHCRRQQLGPGEGQVLALKQRDGQVNGLFCRGMQPGLLLRNGRIQIRLAGSGLQLL
ncbi:Uncharacterised protein [Klebsiella pneumoniae]|nr:Uncharacterised protein [Klebsiella pneumoniae]